MGACLVSRGLYFDHATLQLRRKKERGSSRATQGMCNGFVVPFMRRKTAVAKDEEEPLAGQCHISAIACVLTLLTSSVASQPRDGLVRLSGSGGGGMNK